MTWSQPLLLAHLCREINPTFTKKNFPAHHSGDGNGGAGKDVRRTRETMPGEGVPSAARLRTPGEEDFDSWCGHTGLKKVGPGPG